VARREIVERVAVLGPVEDERHELCAVIGTELDPVAAEDVRRVLGVVRDLEDGGILQDRLQQLHRVPGRDILRRHLQHVGRVRMRQRQVGGAPRLDREADADRLEERALGRGRQDFEGDVPLRLRFVEEFCQARHVVEAGIGALLEIVRSRKRERDL